MPALAALTGTLALSRPPDGHVDPGVLASEVESDPELARCCSELRALDTALGRVSGRGHGFVLSVARRGFSQIRRRKQKGPPARTGLSES